MQAELHMACESSQTEKSISDSTIVLGLQSCVHTHFIRAIMGGTVVVVPNSEAPGSPPFKLKSTSSLHGIYASVYSRRSARTSRYSGSFKEDTSVIDDDDLMDPEGGMNTDEDNEETIVDDMTIEQFLVNHKVKRKRAKLSENEDAPLAGERGRPNEVVDNPHEQSNETGSDLDEPLIVLRKKHKKRGGHSSSQVSCNKGEDKDDRCLASADASLKDSLGAMRTASTRTDISETQTSCWGAFTEIGNRYKGFLSGKSGVSDMSKDATCFPNPSASFQPPCLVNTESSFFERTGEENVAGLSSLSGDCDIKQSFDSPTKPSVEEPEPPSLLENPNNKGQISSGKDLSSEPSQNSLELSLIECCEDMPPESGNDTTPSSPSQANAVSYLNQRDQQNICFASGHTSSTFILESQLSESPSMVIAEEGRILTAMVIAEEGRNMGEQSSGTAFDNTTSDDVLEVCSQDYIPRPQPLDIVIITETSILSHPNPCSSTSELDGETHKPDASLDASNNTYLESLCPSVSTTKGNLVHLDGCAMDSVKPGSGCQVSTTIGAQLTDAMETGSSTSFDGAPTEDADNWFSSQHNNDELCADEKQCEYSQKYLQSCSGSVDVGSLSCNLPKREKQSSYHKATEDIPNVIYNRIRPKFGEIDGLEGRGPAWRQDLESTQAPKRFPSNRKILSPTAKEKLCLEVNAEELYENMQHYRNRKRLWFDKCTDNSSTTSVHKESLSAMSSERGAVKSKLNCCQTKGILKPQSSAQDSMASSKESSVLVSCSQDAIKFSQRQMRDVEFITSKLLAEVKSMKSIMAETLNLEDFSSTPFKSTADKMVLAQDAASAVESTTKKYLSMMNRDLKRFCKIMNSKETDTTSSPATTTSSPPKERKIVFADEAGGSLCNIKYFEEPSSPSVPESESVTV